MAVTTDELRKVLEKVKDPEINRPITDLDMVRNISVDADGAVEVEIALTIAGCPMQSQIERDVYAALAAVDGVTSVNVIMRGMSEAERGALKERLMGERPVIPFSQPGNLTRVYAITSGKGGVGKSSITANLAVALADLGLQVGVLDCDIYGFSIPRMLGIGDAQPTPVGNMMMPPVAHGVKAISMGMFVPDGQPVVWRGPMLHRALEQFLSETYWGDLDVLLLDLPPGTGDVAVSVGQLLPTAEIIVVTTPQQAAAEVAERAGSIGSVTNQKVAGVIENMSYLQGPDGTRMEIFGSGGGETVARRLATLLGYPVPLLGQIPMEQAYREASDSGTPIVLSPDAKDGSSLAGAALRGIATELKTRSQSLKGHRLNLMVK